MGNIYIHFPVIAIMTLFLAAFLIVIFGTHAKNFRRWVAAIGSLISMVLILMLIKPVMLDGEVISYWLGNRTPISGYAIGIGIEVDALNLFFGILVVLTTFLSTIYSTRYMDRDDYLDRYYTLSLMMAGSVLGLTLTGDIFNMFVMIEIMTFTAVALTAFRNWSAGGLEASFKYLVLGSIGSSFILLGIALLYRSYHTLNMAQLTALISAEGGIHPMSILAFGLLFAGFGVKSYVVPFHPAAADAYMAAPSSVSMMFSGMVNKAGVYAMIRLLYVIFQTMGLTSIQCLVVLIGAVTMFIGVTMALKQHDMKRLLAFHSISQIGYVITAVGLATGLGLAGGLYHAMNHTLFKGLLFLCAGAIFYCAGTTNLDRLGGLAKRMPQTTIIFLIGAFSISGIPPFNGFASKWIIYQATYDAAAATGNFGFAVVTVIAVVVSSMTLASFIKVSQSVFFGQLPAEFKEVKEAPLAMRIPMWIMAVLCIVTGLFPKFINQYLLQPAVNAATSVGNYIDAMMGQGYAADVGTVISSNPFVYDLPGTWDPINWVRLFIMVLIAFLIFSLLGNGAKGRRLEPTEDNVDGKFATFYGGEKSEHSMVGGGDLFWGLKHNFRHYFNVMDKAHSGIVNDYALWTVCAAALFIVYAFIFM